MRVSCLVSRASYHLRVADTVEPATTDSEPTARAHRVRVRSIAFPTEHGGWGFTLEPNLLGLLVAPSAAGWALSAAAIGIFLARRPVKLVSTDLVRKRWLPRSRIALLFALLYGGMALAGTIGAFYTAEGPFWIPVLVAIPFALVALRADAQSKNRALIPELSGSIAMGATVSAIALGGGWDLGPAFGLWLVLAARDVAAIVLVRGQIRRVKGRPTGASVIYAVQVACVGVIAVAALGGIVPWLAVVATAVVGLVSVVSLNRPPVEARVIGWTQMGVGLMVVVVTAAGVRLGW